MKTSKVFTAVMLLGVFTAATLCYGQPSLINFQGKLTDKQANPWPQTVDIEFSIYDVAEGGNPVWTETHPAVDVIDGIFSVLLGRKNSDLSSVFDGGDRWLGITFGQDSEMTPRSRIVSVGYAFQAHSADTAEYAFLSNHADTAEYALNLAGCCWKCPPEGGPVYTLRGSAGIGTDDPEAKLHVVGNNIYLGPDADNRLGFGYSSQKSYVASKSEGDFYYLFIRGDPVVVDRGNLGVGTDNPQYLMHVEGSAQGTGNEFIPLGYFNNTAAYNGFGIQGMGPTRGVVGIATNPNGNGVHGETAENGSGAGVFGYNKSASGKAIWAKQDSTGYAIYSGRGKNYFADNLGIKVLDPTALFDVNSVTGYNQVRMRASFTPTSTGDTRGEVGEIAWDDNYIYVKTSTGWKRAALSTW